MPKPKLNVVAVVGSPRRRSATGAVVRHIARQLEKAGCAVDLVDFSTEPLPLFNPESAYTSPAFLALKPRVERADVFVLSTPDYHGSISSTLKNFLDHFWREFAGKLFVTLVASHDKGLTVADQLRTVARQCYAWSLPYSLAFAEGVDVKDHRIVNRPFQARLKMAVRDTCVYGTLLARQRRADLAGKDPGFLARVRD